MQDTTFCTQTSLVCRFLKNLDLVQFRERLKCKKFNQLVLNTDNTHLKKLLIYLAESYVKLKRNSQKQKTEQSQESSLIKNYSFFQYPTNGGYNLSKNHLGGEINQFSMTSSRDFNQSQESSFFKENSDQQMINEMQQENEELKKKIQQSENFLQAYGISIFDNESHLKPEQSNQPSFQIRYSGKNQFNQQIKNEKQQQESITNELIKQNDQLILRLKFLERQVKENNLVVQGDQDQNEQNQNEDKKIQQDQKQNPLQYNNPQQSKLDPILSSGRVVSISYQSFKKQYRKSEQEDKEISEEYNKIIVQIFEKQLKEQSETIERIRQITVQTNNFSTKQNFRRQTTKEIIDQLTKEWSEIQERSQKFQNHIKIYLNNLTNETQDQRQQSKEKYKQEFLKYKEEIKKINLQIDAFIKLLQQKMKYDQNSTKKPYEEVNQILKLNIQILNKTSIILDELMQQIEIRDKELLDKNKELLESQFIIAQKVEEQNQQFERHSQVVTGLLKQIENQYLFLQQNEDENCLKPDSREATQDIKNNLLYFLENALMNSHQNFSIANEECQKMIASFREMDIAVQKQYKDFVNQMTQHIVTLIQIYIPENVLLKK